MASVATGSVVCGAASSSTNAFVTLQGSSWSDSDPAFSQVDLYSKWGILSLTDQQYDGSENYQPGNWNPAIGPLTADKTYQFAVRGVFFNSGYEDRTGTTKYKKTGAVVASASTPTSSAITNSTATIACNYFPNTLDSTCSAQLQYKKTADSTWINAGTPGTSGGYSEITSLSRNLTGLSGSTQYQVRLVITRDTTNTDGQSLTSATHSFTTLADAPTVTTDAASGVAHDSAILNATVDPNTISTDVTFEWDTNSGAPYANETSPASNQTGDGDRTVSKGITGLSASTPYYFRVKAVHAGGTVYGSERTFNTSANPAAEAAEAEMLPIQDFDRKYGVATTVYFVAPAPAATSSNLLYTGAAVWAAAGESKISKDGGAFVDTTNDPAQVGSQLYSLALTAAEMQCDQAFIVLNDAGGAVRDVLLRVRTHQQLGSVDIDAATGSRSNTTAFKATGFGSGDGIRGVAGATGKAIAGVLGDMVVRNATAQVHGIAGEIKLDSLANANNEFYTGTIVLLIAGTGAGQARAITSYNGTTKVAVVDSSWVVNPVGDSVFVILPGPRVWNMFQAQLSAMPADNANYGDKMQLLFQRFAFKISQTATVQTLFKSDSATTLATRSVSDAAGTQIVGKLA